MNNVQLNIIYVSNFNFRKNTNTNLNTTVFKNDKTITKQFILLLLLLNFFFKSKNIKYFVLPYSKSNLTILRSPYRHKLARHQLSFNKFYLNLKIFLPLKKFIKTSNLKSVLKLLGFFKIFLNFLETNICFQHKYRVSFYFTLVNFFKLNYKM